jgi:hypothetical protein
LCSQFLQGNRKYFQKPPALRCQVRDVPAFGRRAILLLAPKRSRCPHIINH